MKKFLELVEESNPGKDIDALTDAKRSLQRLLMKSKIEAHGKAFEDILRVRLDDGRVVEDREIMWMRIRLLEGGLDSDTQAKYQKIVNAEQAEFERVDALYETEKSNATDD